MKQFVYILVLLTSVLSLKSQTVIYQDICNCGVTAAGFSTGLGTGSGNFNIYIEPGSTIKKAYAYTYRVGYPPPVSIELNGSPLTFDTLNIISVVNHLNTSASPIFLLEKDITFFLNSGNTNFSIIIPDQFGLPLNWGYWTLFIVVVYENPLLLKTGLSIIANKQDFFGNNTYLVSDLNPISINYPVGFSIYSDRMGVSLTSVLYDFIFNGTFIGSIGGNDAVNQNYSASGVKGHFYYQNNTLFGLDDDTPDNLMDKTDALADVSSYISNMATGVDFQLKHQNFPNMAPISVSAEHLFFLTYTSPCDTFTATLTSDTAVCAGEALQLNATGGASTGSAQPYEWTPQVGLSCYDCPNPVFSFQHDTVINYSVRIRNNDSCSKVLPLRIWVKPKPHITSLNITKPACGSANGQIHITGLSGAQPPYEYTLNGQPQSSGLFTGLAAGNYPLNITGANGCGLDTVITLNDTLLVNAQFTANPQEGTAPLTVQFTNQSTNATNYLWLINGETFSTENITYSFQQSGNYNALLIAYNNTPLCADTFSMNIFVYDELSVIVPNIFTANGDGVNEVFGINVNVGCTVQAFIYNRWGAEVENITKEISGAGFIELWNGHNHTEGVYFYVIKAKPNFGEEQVLKGNVTLVK